MDDAQIRQIFREELAAFFAGQTPATLVSDADHMARLILEGRGKEIKKQQHLKLTGRAA